MSHLNHANILDYSHEIQLAAGATVTVVGDIYGCKKQFYSMLEQIQPSSTNLFVSVGNIYRKNQGDEIVDKIKQIGYAVRGNNEEKLLRKKENISNQLKWMSKQPLSMTFRFINGTRLTVLNAGVKPGHTWLDLKHNTDLLYIYTLDENKEPIPLRWANEYGKKLLKPIKEGKVWHEYYDGRFGYIASGHSPQTDGVPKFYNYSCNLNTSCYTTGILTSQTFSENGREKLWQTQS